jgi:hypothetical protein
MARAWYMRGVQFVCDFLLTFFVALPKTSLEQIVEEEETRSSMREQFDEQSEATAHTVHALSRGRVCTVCADTVPSLPRHSVPSAQVCPVPTDGVALCVLQVGGGHLRRRLRRGRDV